MKNKIILFDIDHTLFDTNTFRQTIINKLHELIPEMTTSEIDDADIAAHKKMKSHNTFSPKEFADLFSGQVHHTISSKDIVHIWTDVEVFSKSIYGDVLSVLKTLQERGYRLGIFSTGVMDYQMAKIEAIAHYFDKQSIHVFEIKDERLQEIILQYKDNDVVIIDDALHILKIASDLDVAIKTVWVKRSEWTSSQHIENFEPDISITSLTELLQYEL